MVKVMRTPYTNETHAWVPSCSSFKCEESKPESIPGATKPAMPGRCVCGESDVVHRTDGPCYGIEKPKHSTPVDFARVGSVSVDSWSCDSDGPQDRLEVARIIRRQREAANHAIAHLRKMVEFELMLSVAIPQARTDTSLFWSEANAFLRALDNGTDFPEMPA